MAFLSSLKILKSNRFHLQKRKIKKPPRIALEHMVTGTGQSMYRPKDPEVLINSMARFNSTRF